MTRSGDLQAMTFALGAGASATSFMLARLPVAPRYSHARMSSMARSSPSKTQLKQEVNGMTAPCFARLVLAAFLNDGRLLSRHYDPDGTRLDQLCRE